LIKTGINPSIIFIQTLYFGTLNRNVSSPGAPGSTNALLYLYMVLQPNNRMKKLVYQIDEKSLGYLEAEGEEMEKLMHLLQEQRCDIRKLENPHELMEALQKKEPTSNPEQPSDS